MMFPALPFSDIVSKVFTPSPLLPTLLSLQGNPFLTGAVPLFFCTGALGWVLLAPMPKLRCCAPLSASILCV